MREIRQSGSEGGGTELNRSSLPLSLRRCDPQDRVAKVFFPLRNKSARAFETVLLPNSLPVLHDKLAACRYSYRSASIGSSRLARRAG